MGNIVRIVCYGDSNTWGYNPKDGSRYDEQTRWTGRLKNLLGQGYDVVECGINGRTTSFDDPYREFQNGRKGLGYCFHENKPIDLLIISLGTNDLKYTHAGGAARGLAALLRTATHSEAFDSNNRSSFRDGKVKILVLSPINLASNLEQLNPHTLFREKIEESRCFAEVYQPVCNAYGVDFMDAVKFAGPSEIDGIHMAPESHASLAIAVAEKVKEILGQN